MATNAGVAFVGNVGSGAVLGFTALGDAVNVGARLRSYASPGQAVRPPPEDLQVKGRVEPGHVAVLDLETRPHP